MTPIRLLLFCLALAAESTAQPILVEALARHGVELSGRSVEAAFDDGVGPAVPVPPGALATPLGMLSVSTGADRIAAAYAFGILAGRGATVASPAELAAAAQSLVQMVNGEDRHARIAGARVAGRVLAVPLGAQGARAATPAGLTDGLFAMFNRTNELEQLAVMDALGLIREIAAVTALTERYHFYRQGGKRALAGGALEALARIGDPSAVELVKVVAGDRWAEGRDATALAVAFARERLLKDGSIVLIRQAVDDKVRRAQARGYLDELGAPVP